MQQKKKKKKKKRRVKTERKRAACQVWAKQDQTWGLLSCGVEVERKHDKDRRESEKKKGELAVGLKLSSALLIHDATAAEGESGRGTSSVWYGTVDSSSVREKKKKRAAENGGSIEGGRRAD